MKRVVVVGDMVTDVLAVLTGPLAAGSDTPARIHVAGGGQAANTAAWLSWYGVPVTLVAAVGDDEPGGPGWPSWRRPGSTARSSGRPARRPAASWCWSTGWSAR